LPPVEWINVLLVSSRAHDVDNGLRPLTAQEREAVRRGLSRAEAARHVHCVPLEQATLDALRAYLTSHRGSEAPHGIHFDGHGVFGKRCDNARSGARMCRTFHGNVSVERCKRCGGGLREPQGYLVFEDGAGGPDYVSAEELGALLRQAGESAWNGLR